MPENAQTLGIARTAFINLSRHLGTQKQINDTWRDVVSLLREDFDYHKISEPHRLSSLYRAHLPGRCVFCLSWIAHEARSVTASDICRAASRCECSGDEAAHAQPVFVSTFFLRFTRPTLVDHKISSSTCRIG